MSEKRKVIEKIIEVLEKDLKDRQGMWEGIAADVEKEIRSEWRALLEPILEGDMSDDSTEGRAKEELHKIRIELKLIGNQLRCSLDALEHLERVVSAREDEEVSDE